MAYAGFKVLHLTPSGELARRDAMPAQAPQ